MAKSEINKANDALPACECPLGDPADPDCGPTTCDAACDEGGSQPGEDPDTTRWSQDRSLTEATPDWKSRKTFRIMTAQVFKLCLSGKDNMLLYDMVISIVGSLHYVFLCTDWLWLFIACGNDRKSALYNPTQVTSYNAMTKCTSFWSASLL